MRKVIKGRLYDTNTATLIDSHSYGTGGDFSHYEESLYQKKTGEFFLYGEGGPMTRYGEDCGGGSRGFGSAIIPESEFDVKEWVSEHCDVDTYIKLFGPIKE